MTATREIQEALDQLQPSTGPTTSPIHQGARADWLDPDHMPIGTVVQVRLPKGDIFDGMREVAGGKVWVWDAFGGRLRAETPMGWLPKAQRLMPFPERQRYGMDVIVTRTFSALRCLRALRVKSPERAKTSWWPEIVREYQDYLGHQNEQGEYIPRREAGELRIPPPREAYTPARHEYDAMDEPLAWFATLKGPCENFNRGLANPGRGSRPVGMWEFTEEQDVIWDRSLAYHSPPGRGDETRPPEWRLIAHWNKTTTWIARARFEDGMRKIWFIANGGRLR